MTRCYDPHGLTAGPVRLRFENWVEPKGHSELVPYYHFILLTDAAAVAGYINLRVGDTRHIRLCAGHIGYEVFPPYRGRRYAYYACLALAPLVKKHYKEVLLTADPDNAASIRTIEKLGAVLLDQVVVPKDDPSYVHGARYKKRFGWRP